MFEPLPFSECYNTEKQEFLSFQETVKILLYKVLKVVIVVLIEME